MTGILLFNEKFFSVNFYREKFLDAAVESHVRGTVAITTLLKNAPELGSGQIGKEGVLGMMLGMAQTDDKIQQMVAAEALIAASAKKKDASMILREVNTKKNLVKSILVIILILYL